MSDIASSKEKKKVLENPFVGSLVVPIAIVLVGALIIFGVTKLLSTERSHKDLVREMQSKTFGNKWIAAYELSKLISTSQIPKEDIPWVIESLGDVMKDSKEPRTRRFIITALGAMGDVQALPLIERALSDEDKDVQFNGVVALSAMPKPLDFNWTTLEPLLKSEDIGLRQVVFLTMATHRVASVEPHLVAALNEERLSLRFSAATSLINFKNERAIAVLQEILTLNREEALRLGFKGENLYKLKLNVLNALYNNRWNKLNKIIEEQIPREENLAAVGKMREILNELKN